MLHQKYRSDEFFALPEDGPPLRTVPRGRFGAAAGAAVLGAVEDAEPNKRCISMANVWARW